MKTKKIPMRKCVGCNEQSPKKELIRVVKNKENEVSIDVTGKANGRGAYICSKLECLKKAQKKDSLSRALEMKIDKKIYEKLELEFIQKQPDIEIIKVEEESNDE